MIPEEAMQAATKAIQHEFNYDENAAYMARLAVEAAAPMIAAQALRDATAGLNPGFTSTRRWLNGRADRIATLGCEHVR